MKVAFFIVALICVLIIVEKGDCRSIGLKSAVSKLLHAKSRTKRQAQSMKVIIKSNEKRFLVDCTYLCQRNVLDEYVAGHCSDVKRPQICSICRIQFNCFKNTNIFA